ncbi:helix-turn-helix domain-containing protein [Oscillibacter sp.]|uniref:helix-turn-helix domain-containing protein n=1 Tax=Oscillibacter sp. TaxID=1945593 RepID=UPI00260562D4|nr:helix-turn-helix domain-containing protein [Oscillibacter sp.]MDD3346991.1 helix-turn-helix domain-containing protein [Oscillibacter sp.]
MTVGGRIAQKRREQGLSQEALGDHLGVSRQSIYKWESDAALPEIEKLITLSRLFCVSVGWLLGVEEEVPPSTAPEGADELTQIQLKMVEEIVERYLAAQPAPKKRRKWPLVLAGLVLFFAVSNLFEEFDLLRMQNETLQNEISRVEHSVDHQISGISDRVEAVLKAQNNLTADYETSVTGANLAQDQVTFSFRAIPKVFVAGLQASLEVESGGARETFGPYEAVDQTFSGTVTTRLADQISLYIVFLSPDGTRQTQLLESFEGLRAATLPEAEVLSYGHLLDLKADETGRVTLPELFLSVGNAASTAAVNEALGQAELATVRVGLFQNQTLLRWLEPCAQPGSIHGDFPPAEQFFRLAQTDVTLTGTDSICFAAVVTDTYGRDAVYNDIPYILQDGALTWPDSSALDRDAAHWTFS